MKAAWAAFIAFVAKRISFAVEQQTDLWSVFWTLRCDVGKYSLYVGWAKDR